MIQSSLSVQKSPSFSVLSQDQVYEIHRASLEVLEKAGYRIHCEEGVRLLKKAGARVDGEMVKTPQHIVEECIRQAPKGFVLYDREGKRALEVEGRKSYFGTSTASPNTRDAVTAEVNRILDLVHLQDKSDVVAAFLSHGDQKCLEMGMALTNRPDLLLLDEPTAGMGPEETRRTIALIRDVWQRTGTTIIFTEHDLEVVFSISTRIMVLQSGQVIADGTVEEIRSNSRVKEAYLGDQA